MTSDPFDLVRFKTAQERVYEVALAELRMGRKRSHWMWFIFPQLRGLGRSPTAQFYAIASRDEASAYLADPVLGERLHLVTAAVLNHQGRSAREIFGSPDDLKFQSSMTLFKEVSQQASPVFQQALDRYFDGMPDQQTHVLLRES